MSEEAPELKILASEGDDVCPRCEREGMKGKRHKERVRGVWCSGVLTEEEREERVADRQAIAEFRRLREMFWELRRAKRHEEARALCLRGVSAFSYKLREVPEGE